MNEQVNALFDALKDARYGASVAFDTSLLEPVFERVIEAYRSDAKDLYIVRRGTMSRNSKTCRIWKFTKQEIEIRELLPDMKREFRLGREIA